MDVLLAFIVVIAVMALGMIISIGNERQRRALDEIRKQIEGWAAEDIRLKRAKAAREIRVDDPKAWFSDNASKIFGSTIAVEDISVWQNGEAKAVITPVTLNRSLVWTPVPPEIFVRAAQPNGKNRLDGNSIAVLGKNPRKAPHYECSVLTHGPYFDLEARAVWEQITGEKIDFDRMWLYDVRS